jgi:anthranilate/para-aminobenzoate synthase component I
VNAHLKDGREVAAAYDAATAELQALFALLQQPRGLAPAPLVDLPKLIVPAGNFTQTRFEKVVEDGKEYIRSGDIIQFVPSQRFSRPFAKSPLDLYRALRTVNPSPYMFILDAGDFKGSIMPPPEAVAEGKVASNFVRDDHFVVNLVRGKGVYGNLVRREVARLEKAAA